MDSWDLKNTPKPSFVRPPSDVNVGLTKAPVTIVISTINHSDIGVMFTNFKPTERYRTGASHCRKWRFRISQVTSMFPKNCSAFSPSCASRGKAKVVNVVEPPVPTSSPRHLNQSSLFDPLRWLTTYKKLNPPTKSGCLPVGEWTIVNWNPHHCHPVASGYIKKFRRTYPQHSAMARGLVRWFRLNQAGLTVKISPVFGSFL